MALFIDRTDYAGVSSSTTVNVPTLRPVTSKYGGTALLAASSNTVAWAGPQVYGSPRQAGVVFAFSPVGISNTSTGTPGQVSAFVTWGDSGLVTVTPLSTSGSLTLTASGANVNVNNTSSTNGRPVYWSYFGLL